MADDDDAADLPPWNWREHTDGERRAEMGALAHWVARLQEAYGRWVRLPACWPRHRALLDELAAFWYWRQRIDEVPNAPPEEAVRWHQALRVSAQAWADSYGGCRHESLGEIDERRDERAATLAATQPHLDALDGRWDGPRAP